MGEKVVCLGGKAGNDARALLGAELGQDVRRLHELNGVQVLAGLLELVVSRRGGRVVGHGGAADRGVGTLEGGESGLAHLGGRRHVHATRPGGRGQRGGPGDERDLGPPRAGRGGERVAHLPGGAVGYVAHGVDGLVGWAGGDNEAHAGEVTLVRRPVQGAERGGHDLIHGGELALADVAAGETPRARPNDGHAAPAKDLSVHLCGGVLPHARVHAGGHQDGTAVVTGQDRGGEAVVRQAGGDLRHHVGCGRHHEREVRPLRELDVRDGGRRVRVEVVCDGGAAERLEGYGADEPLGVLGHGHTDLAARLLEPPEHLAGLVRGDAAAHGQERPRAAASLCPPRVLAHSPASSEVTSMRWQYGHSVISSPWARSWN